MQSPLSSLWSVIAKRQHHVYRMDRGSATTDGRFAYFTPDDSASSYRYEWRGEKWEEFPVCPCCDSGLVIIDGKLTAVGGWDGSRYTNKLLTLRQRKWVEKYPPMDTARSYPAVVNTSNGEYLIVIGGYVGDGWTATVELFQVKSKRWYKLTNLPELLPLPSATICGYQIGTDANGYSCFLQAVPSGDLQITLSLTLCWKPLPPLPMRDSTAATLCGKLVLIGGRRGYGPPINSIHQLVDGQWVEISSMATDKYRCLVVSQSFDKIIIVGGSWSNFVDECIVAQ